MDELEKPAVERGMKVLRVIYKNGEGHADILFKFESELRNKHLGVNLKRVNRAEIYAYTDPMGDECEGRVYAVDNKFKSKLMRFQKHYQEEVRGMENNRD